MCTIGFRGKGYSPGFIRNYKNIVAQLNQNENRLIEVVQYMDDICSVCPNKIDSITCTSQEKISKLDQNHSTILNLKPGDIISWKDAKELVKKNMSIEKFHSACDGCSWKDYGICESALAKL
jgi:uncharacterized protein